MRKNGKRQECDKCRDWVEKDKGILRKDATGIFNFRWTVWHPQCAPVDLRESWEAQEARKNRKELTDDGWLYTPFDSEALTLLRSLPGAYFDRKQQAWTVSTEVEDRARIVAVCKELGISYGPLWEFQPDQEAIKEAGARASLCAATLQQRLSLEWLFPRERAILNVSEDNLHPPALLAAAGKSRPIIVVADEPALWSSAHSNVTKLECAKDWHWPSPGQVLVVTPSRLPDGLEQKLLGETEQGVGIWDCNFKVESRAIARETLLIVASPERFGDYKSKRSKRLQGLGVYAAKKWIVGKVPADASNLWSLLTTMDMHRQVFGSFKCFMRCFEASNGYRNTIQWGKPTDEAVKRLMRVCYEAPYT